MSTPEPISDEAFQEAQAVVAARQAQDEARRQAQREAMTGPVTTFVSSEAFQNVMAEAKSLREDHEDEAGYFSIHLQALINGGRNLAREVGVVVE